METGHLPIPTAPGLGLDLNLDVVRDHPYDPKSFFDTSKTGWEKRLATGRMELRTSAFFSQRLDCEASTLKFSRCSRHE